MQTPSPESVARHLIKLLGGHEEAFRLLDAGFQEVTRRWAQDTAKIGRILRAHLFVEHFLTEYLQAKNPDLGSLDDARVTFAQKIPLINTDEPRIAYLLPGIRRLNTIRNRIAHSLHADVIQDDANVFLQIQLFSALRNASAKRSQRAPSSDPIDIMEEFAVHAGSLLHLGPTTSLWAEAFRLAQQECTN